MALEARVGPGYQPTTVTLLERGTADVNIASIVRNTATKNGSFHVVARPGCRCQFVTCHDLQAVLPDFHGVLVAGKR